MMETGAKKKGIEFIVQVDPRLPTTFFTDPVRLKQCLINLVGNAVKFTEQGHVGIYVCPDEHAGQPCIRFDVEDTGIGIPRDKQELIFNSFSQADGSTARKYGGTGLGLAITRRLAGLLGGDVRIKSEAPKGSTFSLTLPLFVQKTIDKGRLGQRQARRIDDTPEQYAGHILLAERAFPSQLTLTLMLRRFGLDVRLAGSLDQVRQRIAEQSFDLIFLDAAMGLDKMTHLMEQVRSAAPRTPVVLVADHDGGDAET